ncbi:murein biosynthesis integral membrane protein MurJ [Ahniella affigens]|uniref:Probable lipid II flippase MurJ n=1 Tax=Ahniella affigens TaxID=2021234 RepID=A0A2P1PTN0_9GAMM|nr:murein biosynthesis integral membrane protein MurJ [Ahniella affigens]AVP98207.1 murein biosynthesis integral membrane protein MurJ [Ahniella affigens]
MKLLRSSLVFSFFTLLSRLAGFARDALQASLFGAGPAVSAFVVAYRIPNYLRRIFAEGSFASAFVPVLSELRQKGDQKALQDFLDHIAGALLAAVVVVTGLGMLLSPLLARLFLILAGDHGAQTELVADMLRITFPYLTFISMTALAGSVLNSFRHFGLPAFAPVLHNLSVIFAMLVLARYFAVPEKALAFGVVIAGAAQMLLLWPAMRRLGVMPRFRFNRQHEGVKRVFKLMLPTIFSSSVAQINLLVGTIFAAALAVQAQSWLYYSDRLVEFPLGLFGVAIGTVILPHLSARFADTDHAGFAAAMNWGLRAVLLIAIPAAVGLASVAEPLTATLFGYGKFKAEDVQMTAISVQMMCLGIPAFMASKVLLPAFYARQDTRTPMRIAVHTVIANVVLTILIVTPLWKLGVPRAHAGIACATAMAGTLNAWWLYRNLRQQGLYIAGTDLHRFALKAMLAAVAMAIALHVLRPLVGDLMALHWSNRLLACLCLVAAGALVFTLCGLAFGIRARDLREPVSKADPATRVEQ